MKDRILQILGIFLLAWLFIYIFGNQNPLRHRSIYVSGQTTGNDLVGLLQEEGARVYEYGSVEDALDKAKPGSAVLLLSNEYPEKTQEISTENLETIKSKNLKVFAEFATVPGPSAPSTSSGAEEPELEEIGVERVVVTKQIGDNLKPMDLRSLDGYRKSRRV